MRWEEGRRSDNVESARDEPRPYGEAQVTRNLTTGVISEIDPQDLNIKCPFTLRNEFSTALNEKPLQKEASSVGEFLPDGVVKAKGMKVINPSLTVEQPDCKAKVQIFRYELEDTGLSIREDTLPPQAGVEGDYFVIRAGGDHFRAGKPTTPDPGK